MKGSYLFQKNLQHLQVLLPLIFHYKGLQAKPENEAM